MEILLRPIPCYSGGAAIDSRRQCSFFSTDLRLSSSINPPARRMLSRSAWFSDDGHLQYYSSSSSRRRQRIRATESRIRCGAAVEEEVCQKVGGEEAENTMMKKKNNKNKNEKRMNLKMLKALSRGLSTFSDIGCGLDPGSGSPDEPQLLKGQMISEAAQLLLGRLQELRAEEMELKKRRKDEKAQLKSLQMQNRMDCGEAPLQNQVTAIAAVKWLI